MSDPRRFIGRKATACRKCSGQSFYVNRMGGVVCQECSPPRTAVDNCQDLTIEGGVWIDPRDRFDMVDLVVGGVSPGATTQSVNINQDEVRRTSNPENTTKATIPPELQRSSTSRGPNGELSEAEYELFSSAAVWGTPVNRDLIVTYGKSIIWVSEMFEASDDADRQRASDVTPRDVKSQKERTAALATTARTSMFSV